MELLDFEWCRCRDGYRLERCKPRSARQETKIKERGMVNVEPFANSDYILPNSERFEYYRPLDNVMFKIFVEWPATPEGMIGFCDRYGQLYRPTGLVEIDGMLAEQKAMQICLMLLESGDPAELIKKLDTTRAGGCSFKLRRTADGTLSLVLVPATLVQAMWAQLASHAVSDALLLSCERCGKPFYVGAGTKRRNTAKYCSNACKVAVWQAKQGSAAADRKPEAEGAVA